MKQRNRKVATLAAVSAIVAGSVLSSGCASSGNTVHTKRGAVMGSLIGAGVGAVVGHQSGRALEGAAIGGAAGAVVGGTAGSAKDEADSRYR